MHSNNQGNILVRLNHVAVSYQRRNGFRNQPVFWALQDITLSIFHGETIGIIGRNGVGKSTLLRLIAGIITPDKGSVLYAEKCHASLLSLQVGFIPQLTGRENAILSGMLLGMQRSAVEAKMKEIIEFSELNDFIDLPISTYSTGMRARLGFSIAFQADPDILLVDEVLGVGDAEFREKSSRAMRQKIRSNKTVVLVSHNPQTIRSLCDRVIWIEKGCTRLEGDPNTVLNAYASE